MERFKPPYILEVSYNCGISYGVLLETDDIDRIIAKARELDEKGLRWAVMDSEGKRMPYYCMIHHHIFTEILGVMGEELNNEMANR